jgi:ABC-type Fe3+ transport system substrate-binding protein
MRLGMDGLDPAIVHAREAAFEKHFGFPVRLESEPGHIQRDLPVKVTKAAEAGRGVVDVVISDLPNAHPLLTAGYLRVPPWEELAKIWPMVRTLRERVPAWPSPDGGTLADYCMARSHSPWILVYNTNKVKADEARGLTRLRWEDLTTSAWTDRVVWDAGALALYVFPFAPGWDEQRLRVYAHNLGANGVKLIPGGSPGVVQAVIQGEGDIGVTTLNVVQANLKVGAPLGFAFPEFAGTAFGVTCLPRHGVNDLSMAALYWAFGNLDGMYATAEMGGEIRLYPEEADKFAVGALMKEAGLGLDQLVFPKTPEQNELTGRYRQLAIDALKEGVRTRTRLTQ